MTTTITRTVTHQRIVQPAYDAQSPRRGAKAPGTFRNSETEAPEWSGFVPADAHVGSAAVLGGKPVEAALTWARLYSNDSTTQALSVWRLDADGAWRRTFTHSVAGFDHIYRLQLADVTGDRRADILLLDDTGGSGQCGIWRLYGTVGARVRELWVKRGCRDSTQVVLARGGVLVFSAIPSSKDPSSGTSIHCCWLRWRRTLFRWSGVRRLALRRWDGPVPHGDAWR